MNKNKTSFIIGIWHPKNLKVGVALRLVIILTVPFGLQSSMLLHHFLAGVFLPHVSY